MVHVTGVALDKTVLSLAAGENDWLAAIVYPDNATDKTVTWQTGDSTIASVDGNGKVSAFAQGQTDITVVTNDGSFKAVCTVTVREKEPEPTVIHVASVALDKSTLNLTVGENDRLTADVYPGDATDKTVTWQTRDSTIASVDENGIVTALAPGQTEITVVTNDGGYMMACFVTVEEN